MAGTPIKVGPFVKGLHNSSGTGEFIEDEELFDLVNLEVDFDGSLANRPALSQYNVSGLSGIVRIWGSFLISDGRRYLVISDQDNARINLVEEATGTVKARHTIKTGAIAQFKNDNFEDSLFVVPAPGSGQTGGYFNDDATPSWTDVSSMPEGVSSVMYKGRMWIAQQPYRLRYSRIGSEITTWDALGYSDIDPGNGELITALRVLNDDIIIFKEHSTYRAGYTNDVKGNTIVNVSRTHGAPTDNCCVVYNSIIYVLHDNNAYELYNFTFSSLTNKIRMVETPTGLYPDDVYGLTLFRDRLFVRYFNDLYVYSLQTGRWSRWETERPFSYIITVPIPQGSRAYAHSASPDNAGKIYTFTEDRIAGVQTDESFECSIVTKTYDFDVSYAYKTLFWWSLDIATMADTHGAVTLANASSNPTWNKWLNDERTWQDLYDTDTLWSSEGSVSFDAISKPGLGFYGKKIIKFPKKLRFRQLYFTVTTEAVPNTTADACVRIYNITAFVKPKEPIVKELT